MSNLLAMLKAAVATSSTELASSKAGFLPPMLLEFYLML
jgi:hypothetical protein